MQRNTTQQDTLPLEPGYKADDVADYLGVTRRTVNDMATSGHFPGAFRVGNRWRFPRSALAAYIAAHEPHVHTPGTIEPRRSTRRRTA